MEVEAKQTAWFEFLIQGAQGCTRVHGILKEIFNVEVAFGTDRKEYLDRFKRALTDLAKKLKPDLVMISAGFDAHRSDPIGSLGLEVEDFDTLSRCVAGVAKEYCGGRIVSMLEGGYNPTVLPFCVETHLKVLLEA